MTLQNWCNKIVDTCGLTHDRVKVGLRDQVNDGTRWWWKPCPVNVSLKWKQLKIIRPWKSFSYVSATALIKVSHFEEDQYINGVSRNTTRSASCEYRYFITNNGVVVNKNETRTKMFILSMTGILSSTGIAPTTSPKYKLRISLYNTLPWENGLPLKEFSLLFSRMRCIKTVICFKM